MRRQLRVRWAAAGLSLIACQGQERNSELQHTCNAYQELTSKTPIRGDRIAAVHDEAARLLADPNLDESMRAAVAEVVRVTELPSPTDAQAKGALLGLASAWGQCAEES